MAAGRADPSPPLPTAPSDLGTVVAIGVPDVGPEFRMRMPVELWFGEHHIGVKAGTPTCVEFVRFANAILSEFRDAVHPDE